MRTQPGLVCQLLIFSLLFNLILPPQTAMALKTISLGGSQKVKVNLSQKTKPLLQKHCQNNINSFLCGQQLPPDNTETFFPEWQRAQLLDDSIVGKPCSSDQTCSSLNQTCRRGKCVSDADLYSYETCQSVEEEKIVKKVRLPFSEMDGFENLFPVTPRDWASCDTEDCFFRVNTFHLGRTVRLSGKCFDKSGRGCLSCDDPARPGIGECRLGMNSFDGPGGTNDKDAGYRGNVIIADKIILQGDIELGSLSLVLLARHEIEFKNRTRVIGAQNQIGKFHVRAQAEMADEWADIYGVNGGKFFDKYIQSQNLVLSIPSGKDGDKGASSGNLVLISPKIKSQRSQILLNGATGDTAQGTPSIDCSQSKRPSLNIYGRAVNRKGSCELRVRDYLAKNKITAGNGGLGGDGGMLIIRTNDYPDRPWDLQTFYRGGWGGKKGEAGTYDDYEVRRGFDKKKKTRYKRRNYLYTFVKKNRSVGTDGKTGSKGANGSLNRGDLNNDFSNYAYLFSKRGADRHLINAQHFARFAPENQSADRKSKLHLHQALNHYCNYEKANILSQKIKINLNYSPPTKSSDPLIDPETIAKRKSFCDEAEAYLNRLEAGLNHFGFPQDFFMYVPPHLLADWRTTIVDNFKNNGGMHDIFSNLSDTAIVRHLLTNQVEHTEFLTETTANRLRAGQLREEFLIEKSLVTEQLFKKRQEQIASITTELENLARQAHQKMEPEDCDFICELGNIFSKVMDIASFVGRIIKGIEDGYSFLSAIEDLNGFLEGIHEANLKEHKHDIIAAGDSIIEWANLLYDGYKKKNKNDPRREFSGIGKTVDFIESLDEEWEKAENAFDGLSDTFWRDSRNPADSRVKTIIAAGATNRQTLVQLNDLHGEIRNSIDYVTQATGLIDAFGARSDFQKMLTLVEQQMAMAREAEVLLRDHVIASAELALMQHELVLLQSNVDKANELLERVNERAHHYPTNNTALARDLTCELARPVNDQVLLFDYLYNRSLDYVHLDHLEDPQLENGSYNFQRNLLDPHWERSFSQASSGQAIEDAIRQLHRRSHGTEYRSYCDDTNQGCEFNSKPVVSQLKLNGQGEFTIEGPFSTSPPVLRKRVTNADIVLRMAPNYSLGCHPDLNNCSGFLGSYQYRMSLGHSEVSTFLWENGQKRSFYFSEEFPQQACRALNNFLEPSHQVECSDLPVFTDDSIHYRDPLTYALQTGPLDGYSYNPIIGEFETNPLFGTSLAGSWNLNIRPILRQLNGPGTNSDGCYDFVDTGSLPESCLPKRFLSPCFDDFGNLKTKRPLMCDICYTPRGHFNTRHNNPDLCQDLPEHRNFVWDERELPEIWQPDTQGYRDIQNICEDFINDDKATGQYVLENHPDTPDVCWEICGPRCKAFKENLEGFDWIGHWR